MNMKYQKNINPSRQRCVPIEPTQKSECNMIVILLLEYNIKRVPVKKRLIIDEQIRANYRFQLSCLF